MVLELEGALLSVGFADDDDEGRGEPEHLEVS
jgi:hypothetical protein